MDSPVRIKSKLPWRRDHIINNMNLLKYELLYFTTILFSQVFYSRHSAIPMLIETDSPSYQEIIIELSAKFRQSFLRILARNDAIFAISGHSDL